MNFWGKKGVGERGGDGEKVVQSFFLPEIHRNWVIQASLRCATLPLQVPPWSVQGMSEVVKIYVILAVSVSIKCLLDLNWFRSLGVKIAQQTLNHNHIVNPS